MSESILTSIKQGIGGIPDGYEAFDAELILLINAELARLCQLGVGPEEGFYIASKEETWDQFITDPRLNMAKEYVTLRVKVVFDNSTTPSTVLNIYNQKAEELEWVLCVEAEHIKAEESES